MDEFKRAWDYPKAWNFGQPEDAGEYTTSDGTELLPKPEPTENQCEIARLRSELAAVQSEYAAWRKGIGVSEHLALIEENKRLRAEIAELREREGRDGCEYCRDGENLAYGHDSMQRTGMIYIDGNLLTADLFSESMAVPIFYCPVCGGALEAKREKEKDERKERPLPATETKGAD